MVAMWMRLRVAPRLSTAVGQLAIGVLATGIASAVFPSGSSAPPANPPLAKISLRIEPQEASPLASPPGSPLLAETRGLGMASVAPRRMDSLPPRLKATPPAGHKSKPVVAVLPPARPRETAAALAELPQEPVAAPRAPAPVWIAAPRAAVDMTLAALRMPRPWTPDGRGLLMHAAVSAGALVDQVLHPGL